MSNEPKALRSNLDECEDWYKTPVRHYKVVHEHDRRLSLANDNCNGTCLQDGKCSHGTCGELSMGQTLISGLGIVIVLLIIVGYVLFNHGEKIGSFVLSMVVR